MTNIVTDANFNEEVITFKGLVLVDFWAPWCGPCQMLAPVIEEIASELGNKIKVVKVNIDENPQTAQNFLISSIPTIIIFDNGEIKEKLIGYRNKQDYIEAINK